MAEKSLLDSIDVPAPCPQSWDAMRGGDKVRFCGNCEKDIHNLSAMTRGEIKKLLLQSKESVCIRMEKDADGKIKTLKKQFHQITRRMPIAAGILSASLTLSTFTQAQEEIIIETTSATVSSEKQDKKTQSQSIKDAQSAASISGTVSDINGSVIPNAQITLSKTKTAKVYKTKSNDEGFYEFKNLESGVYQLTAILDGFKKTVYQNIEVKNSGSLQLTIELESEGMTTVGLIAEMSPIIGTTESHLGTTVQSRQIETLPVSNRKMPVLGLCASGETKSADEKAARNLSQISFTIYDPNNKIISNETVELTNKRNKQEFTALTNQNGVARFNSIPHGRYDLTVSGNGFNESRQTIQIKESVEPNIEITLTVGSFTGEVAFDWSEIPLFRAIAQDDNDTVKQIIEKGFAANTKDESGETALHVAVQQGNMEIVRSLLDKGAKVKVKDKAKRTPLAMLFDSFEDDEKINREILRLLVSKGANINVRDEDSQTFLMLASEDGDLEKVRFLLDSGAKPNLKNDKGETAFDKTDSEEIKRLLIAHGSIH